MTSNPDSDCLSLPGFSEETEESSLRSRELVKGRKGAGGGGHRINGVDKGKRRFPGG